MRLIGRLRDRIRKHLSKDEVKNPSNFHHPRDYVRPTRMSEYLEYLRQHEEREVIEDLEQAYQKATRNWSDRCDFIPGIRLRPIYPDKTKP